MRLDPDSLQVQSFAVSAVPELAEPSDTGRDGPRSYCWICYNTDDTVPSCGYKCMEPDTFVNPNCTYA